MLARKPPGGRQVDHALKPKLFRCAAGAAARSA